MSVFELYLDIGASSRVMVHLLEPPGLGMRFESRAAMARDLSLAIREHLSWLRAHGEPVLPNAGESYRIVEEIPIAGNFESGDDVGFYAPDTVPVTSEDVDRYLRLAGYAHDDLTRLVSDLSDAELDWVRDDRTRPIRRIIRHVVAAELWYMTRIVDDPDLHAMPEEIANANRRIDATEDMVERLGIVWPVFQSWARGLPPELRRRITLPTWFTERREERWSARKMLRRCIEHCREHTRNIEHILDYYQRAALQD